MIRLPLIRASLLLWLLLLCSGAVTKSRDEEIMEVNRDIISHYEEYLKLYKKDPSRSRDRQRIDAFKTNIRLVQSHNNVSLHVQKKKLFSLRINQFSDWTQDEIAAIFSAEHFEDYFDSGHSTSRILHPDSSISASRRQLTSGSSPATPVNVNWADAVHNPTGHRVVTEVGNQGMCGACWAYSAVYATEASVRITGLSVSLNVQELLDCDRNGTSGMGLPAATANNGCSGGNPIRAFSYILKYGLGERQSSVNCKEQVQQCMIDKKHFSSREKRLSAHRGSAMASSMKSAHKKDKKAPLASISSFVVLPSGDEAVLKDYVGRVGPVAVGICGTDPRFVYYGQGILDISDCCTTLNHALLVVGYGSEGGVDYWVAQNSWGEAWGDGGFVKIKRFDHTQTTLRTVFHKGICGMAQSMSVPLGGFLSTAPAVPVAEPPDAPPTFILAIIDWVHNNASVI
mmetsp:Transcript_15264/g.25365  ORF Transcript_15264/g.25365 Transcript_15264/m.25365 type:complete len:456 (-) Transcript_15264:377-1744(-)